MKEMMKLKTQEGVYAWNKEKISIQLSFHDIVLLYIWLYSVDVLCIVDCLHQWLYTTNMHVMGKVLYNLLQEKKDETCSKEQVMTIQ